MLLLLRLPHCCKSTTFVFVMFVHFSCDSLARSPAHIAHTVPPPAVTRPAGSLLPPPTPFVNGITLTIIVERIGHAGADRFVQPFIAISVRCPYLAILRFPTHFDSFFWRHGFNGDSASARWRIA